MTEQILTDIAEDMRLDRYIRRHVVPLPQSLLETHLRAGHIRINGEKVRSNHRLKAGDRLTYPDTLPQIAPSQPAMPSISQQDAMEKITSMTVATTPNYYALNKPAGLAVQGGTSTKHHLDGFLRAAFPDDPPRLVHRLDRDTSGLMLVARTSRAAQDLARAFRHRAVTKAYLALTVGMSPTFHPHQKYGTITARIGKAKIKGIEKIVIDEEGGQEAETDFIRLAHADTDSDVVSLLALLPRTGRTHQLRVHLASIGMPILGDGKYGGRAAHIDGCAPQLHLHSWSLRLSTKTLTAPLSVHMLQSLSILGLAGFLPTHLDMLTGAR